MKKGLTATQSIELNVPSAAVWKALTDPKEIKKYFFGTNAISEWKEGSPIVFKGEWEGQSYEDKGTIIEIISGKKLKYTYWSSFSGTEDIPENYANICYYLTPKGKGTLLEITQDGIDTEERKNHSESNWKTVLEKLKELLTS